MFPLYDKSRPLLKTPYVVIALIVLNVIVFIFEKFYEPLFGLENLFEQFGLVPEKFVHGENLFSIFSCMFLHSGFFHLAINMWFLWVFGRSVEDGLGKVRFVFLYLLAGIFAGLGQIISGMGFDVPSIGASGAISGVMGAYLILYPRNKIRTFILLIFYPLRFDLPAYIFLIYWFFFQVIYVNTASGIGYAAHAIGFVAGVVLAYFLKNKERQDYVLVGNELVEAPPQ